MLMKYKDFKTMSQNEMKGIKGGVAVEEPGTGGVCKGECKNCVGEWFYAPQNGTYAGCLSDIQTYCRSGEGKCYSSCGGGGIGTSV
jgi:bacteriocin-like protein